MTTIQKKRTQLGNEILTQLSKRPINWRKNGVSFQHQQIQKAIHDSKFHQAFTPLKIMRDYYRGIHSTYEVSKDGHPILIRDARTQESSINKYQCEANYYKYAQLGLNYLNGLKILLEIKSKQDKNINLTAATNDLIEYAKTYYRDITPTDANDKQEQKRAEQQAEEKFSYFFHYVIKPLYQLYAPDLDEKALENELRLGRNFANMEVTPYAVATITRHDVESRFQAEIGIKKQLDVVELELPMVKLTDEQKSDYDNRKNQDWYTKQSETAQSLIDCYAEKIKTGAMIPAQLVYHLIGTRNSYEKWTALLNPYRKATSEFVKYKVINTTYHTATQAHIFKRNGKKSQSLEEDAVSKTVDQLISLTDATYLSINSLVTPLGSLTSDNLVTRQIKNATNSPKPRQRLKREISFSNTPLNVGRRIATRNITGITQLANIAQDFLNNNGHAEPIKKYLKNANSDFLEEKPQRSLLEIYFTLVKLQKIIEKKAGFYDPNNQNLEIATQANLLIHALNEAQSIDHYVLASGCFSGQDRGGMLSTHTSNEAVVQYLTFESTDKNAIAAQRQSIEKTQAKAGHTSEMAGNAGTGFGGEGIKPHSSGIIPQYYPKAAKDNLLHKTAIFNQKFPKQQKDSLLKKIIRTIKKLITRMLFRKAKPKQILYKNPIQRKRNKNTITAKPFTLNMGPPTRLSTDEFVCVNKNELKPRNEKKLENLENIWRSRPSM